MFDGFVPSKRIRRFSHSITVLEKGRVSVQLVEDEKYLKAYESLFMLIDVINTDIDMRIILTFIGEEYISFVCVTQGESCTLNFSLKSGLFERDSVVLKYCGLSRKDVSKVLKGIKEKPYSNHASVYLFPHGIGVLCGNKGEKNVKIRNL